MQRKVRAPVLLQVGAVVNPEFEEELPWMLMGVAVDVDNAFWRREVQKPFTWQRFLNWWIARRYVDRSEWF